MSNLSRFFYLIANNNLAIQVMPHVYISDNIFARIEFSNDECALWYVYWWGGYDDGGGGLPESFTNNIVWETDGELGVLSEYDDDWSEETYDYSMSSWMATTTIEADPLFTYSSERGSYDLDPSSPAIDAGSGARDPDGTRNDIGAFGGPNGDWWKDVTWLP